MAVVLALAALGVGGCADDGPTLPCIADADEAPAFDPIQALTAAGFTVENGGENLALLTTPARWRTLRVDGALLEWYRYCDAALAEAEVRRFTPGLPAVLGEPPLVADYRAWLVEDAYLWITEVTPEMTVALDAIFGEPFVVPGA